MNSDKIVDNQFEFVDLVTESCKKIQSVISEVDKNQDELHSENDLKIRIYGKLWDKMGTENMMSLIRIMVDTALWEIPLRSQPVVKCDRSVNPPYMDKTQLKCQIHCIKQDYTLNLLVVVVPFVEDEQSQLETVVTE